MNNLLDLSPLDPNPIVLKVKDIKPMRDKMVEEVKSCSLCGKSFDSVQRIALDHCHITGRIREPLCTWCNSQLGKIENACIRSVGKENMLTFLENAYKYVAHHSANPSAFQHPTHGKVKKRKKQS